MFNALLPEMWEVGIVYDFVDGEMFSKCDKREYKMGNDCFMAVVFNRKEKHTTI